MSKVDNFSFCCCKIPYQCLEYNSFCCGMLSFPTFCLPCLYMSPKKFGNSFITNCEDNIDLDKLPFKVTSTLNESDEIKIEQCTVCCTLMCCPIKCFFFIPCIPCLCYDPPWEQ